MRKIRHLDWFSGIGGFALAAGMVWPGHAPVAFCEMDGFCKKVLKKHWPDVPVIDNADDYEEYDFDAIDLFTAGFPCQPFSNAGSRKGTADARYKWPQTIGAIERFKPRWVLLENVAGLLSIPKPAATGALKVESRQAQRFADCDLYNSVLSRQEKMLVAQIIEDLQEAGYALPETWEGTPVISVVPAAGVGAPHIRDRVWIMAYADKIGECAGFGEVSEADGEISKRDKNAESRYTGDVVADAGGERRHRPATRESGFDKSRNDSPQGEKGGNEFYAAESGGAAVADAPEERWKKRSESRPRKSFRRVTPGGENDAYADIEHGGVSGLCADGIPQQPAAKIQRDCLPNADGERCEARRGFQSGNGARFPFADGEDDAYADIEHCLPDADGGDGERGHEPGEVWRERCAGEFAEKAAAWGDQWRVEPGICRVVNGIPDRTHRVGALGNGIVPQVAAGFLMCIRETDKFFDLSI